MRKAGLAGLGLAAALALGAASAPALAANCGVASGFTGFTDVQDTDTICNSVQWLRNRQITVGCTSTTTYCPLDPVTRGSMALFLNRTGVALTPKLVGRQSGTSALSLNPNEFNSFCFGAALPAVNYPQTARARGTISIPMTGPMVDMFLVISFNDQPYQNMNSTFNRVTAPNGTVRINWSSNTLDVPPGVTVGFAIGLSNPAGSGAPLNLGAGICALEADLVNRNPTTAPFDEQQ